MWRGVTCLVRRGVACQVSEEGVTCLVRRGVASKCWDIKSSLKDIFVHRSCYNFCRIKLVNNLAFLIHQ